MLPFQKTITFFMHVDSNSGHLETARTTLVLYWESWCRWLLDLYSRDAWFKSSHDIHYAYWSFSYLSSGPSSILKLGHDGFLPYSFLSMVHYLGIHSCRLNYWPYPPFIEPKGTLLCSQEAVIGILNNCGTPYWNSSRNKFSPIFIIHLVSSFIYPFHTFSPYFSVKTELDYSIILQITQFQTQSWGNDMTYILTYP
jgi:hypothetical protein